MLEKTFAKVLSEISLFPERAKRSLNDKRLTQAERTIIECYLMSRDKQNAEVITKLTQMNSILSPFVLAHKNLMFGIAYGNTENFSLAESHFTDALKYFIDEQYTDFEFTTRVNLFILYLNSLHQTKMKKMLDALLKVVPQNTKGKIRALLCEFFYYRHIEDVEKCLDRVDKLRALKEYMPESDYPPFLSNIFAFYIKQNKFDEAKGIVQEMKLARKYGFKESFKYCKLLLDHYMENKPIYFYDKGFENFPSLFNELKVIQKLEESDIDGAVTYWNELRTTYPQNYKEGMKYVGNKNIFSMCLDKYQDFIKSSAVPNTSSLEDESIEIGKQNFLLQYFQQSKIPIRKDDLYKMVWGQIPESKENMNRLINMIYRLKKEHNLNIKTRKGCYYIEESDEKKAS